MAFPTPAGRVCVCVCVLRLGLRVALFERHWFFGYAQVRLSVAAGKGGKEEGVLKAPKNVPISTVHGKSN